LSFCIIGIGEEGIERNFSKMEELDADDGLLSIVINGKKKEAKRDIV